MLPDGMQHTNEYLLKNKEMKKLILSSCLLLLGMSVKAQEEPECKVNLIVTFFNIKNMQTLFISESSSIGVSDVVHDKNIYTYSLNTSQTYMFMFSDEEVEKHYMINTSSQCGNILNLNVDLQEPGSLVSFWKDTQYTHVHFDDQDY